MLDWFKRGAGPTPNAGIFELYRQRAEELRRTKEPGLRVGLRTPRGLSHVQLFSGTHRGVAPDGTVEMSEADAARCRAAISIPMVGRSESLNAGVAASLVAFEALRQRQDRDGTRPANSLGGT